LQFSRRPHRLHPTTRTRGYLVTVPFSCRRAPRWARTDAVNAARSTRILTSTSGRLLDRCHFAGLERSNGLNARFPTKARFLLCVQAVRRGALLKASRPTRYLASINQRLAKLDGAFVHHHFCRRRSMEIGNAGGFQDDAGRQEEPWARLPLESRRPQELGGGPPMRTRALSGVFTPFTSTTPNLYADIDRVPGPPKAGRASAESFRGAAGFIWARPISTTSLSGVGPIRSWRQGG